LKKAGTHPEGSIADLLKAAQEEVDGSKSDPSFYSTVITNDDIETAHRALEDFIYGPEGETNGVNGTSSTQDGDVAMEDTNGTAEEEEAKV
jgi:guanylate kinase